MQRQLAAFVEQPSKATFLAARDAVQRESSLPLSAVQIAELEQLLELEDYQSLLARLDALPPSKVLSPRVHFLAAETADALGDFADMELERCLFVIVLQGLLATGDGTRANPYIVSHVSDEHDILAALGLQASRQITVENAGSVCDILLCTDGREVWFDITQTLGPTSLRAQKSRLSRRRRPRRRRLAR
jgi:hypothetical protein